MHEVNWMYLLNCSGVCRYSPCSSVRGSFQDDVGLDAFEFLDEAGEIDDQILFNREVGHRFDADPVRIVVADEGFARQFWNAVDRSAATAQMAIRQDQRRSASHRSCL